MSGASPLNPLGYLVRRQYTGGAELRGRLFRERFARAKNLYRKDLFAHYGCVNAIEFSDEGELLVSGGDDRRVLLWNLAEAIYGKRSPFVMQTCHVSNIFCLGFDSQNSKIFSGGNDDQVIIHDTRTGQSILKLPHRKPVYGLSVNPQNDCILATAGDDGRVLIFDLRDSSDADPLCLAKQKTGFHSVTFNPANPRWLATANSEEGIVLWDYRKPKEQLIHYGSNVGQVSGISACFNSNGSHLLALRRRLPPVLYETQNETAVCQFYHPNYYNSCTMKTCSFAGEDDEYVLSGSDDFNLYVWKIPREKCEWGEPHVVLHGHRSIVNQVRYNRHNNLIASSGVEKMVKLWSTLPIGTWSGSLLKEHMEAPRSVYSHDDYVYLVGHGERISHDYSDMSMQEDSKMMAFFDSLIQREIEGWDSPSDETLSSDSDSDFCKEEVSAWRNMLCGKKPDDVNKKHKPNRIAQLIAQKRNRLAKMAHGKSSNSIKKYSSKEKLRKRKLAQKAKASKYTKHNGYTKKSAMKSNNVTNHSSSPEKDIRKHKVEPEKPKLRKYRTRQSLKEMYDTDASSNPFDTPSTSTGITGSSNSLFRVIEQDSDDEIPPNVCIENHNSAENNLINILPTPLNGTHDLYINVLEMNNTGSTASLTPLGTNVVTIRNEEYGHASTSNGVDRWDDDQASTSTNNGRYLRRGSGDCDEQCSTSNGSYLKRKNCFSGEQLAENCINENSYHSTYLSESESDYEFNHQTPPPSRKRRSSPSVTDSGCGSGPCSSSGSYSLRNSKNYSSCNNGFNQHSSDDDYAYVSFKKRVKKAKLNIRKHIGADSDSN